MWPELQRQWAESLLNPVSVPVGVANDRFGVYRNNVTVNVRDALRASYPVVEALLGEDCFNDVARQFIRGDPPRSPVLIDYGGSFADFLASHELAADVPYLADIACLEWARHEAYHAADAEPVGIDGLGDIPAPELDAVRLTLHPSARVLRSNWPTVSIWHAHLQPDVRAALADLPPSGECALVVRPALDVEVRVVSDEMMVLLGALSERLPLAEAIDAAASAGPRDVSGCLQGVFSMGAITAIERPPREKGETQ